MWPSANVFTCLREDDWCSAGVCTVQLYSSVYSSLRAAAQCGVSVTICSVGVTVVAGHSKQESESPSLRHDTKNFPAALCSERAV